MPSLENKLVEICGVVDGLVPRGSNPDPIPANGKVGRATLWSSAKLAYIVETFDGLAFDVPDANLQVYKPPPVEKGGFDVMWPGGSNLSEIESFGEDVVISLAKRGYCVIQTCHGWDDCEPALAAALRSSDWELPRKEFETAYLGFENCTKYSMLRDDNLDRKPSDTLEYGDRRLTQLSMMIEPFSSRYLGFTLFGRMSGMVRVQFEDQSERNRLCFRSLDDEDYASGLVVGHLNFLERRRLLVMSFLDCQGGDLILHSNSATSDLGWKDIRLPLVRGRIVILRSDVVDYSYKPTENDTLLQTWLVSEPSASAMDLEKPCVVNLPDKLHGDRVHCKSLAARLPGSCSDISEFWTLLVSGGDTAVRVPLPRFDIDAYYSADADEGLTYATHGTFCHDSVCDLFCNELFEISEEEAVVMEPSQRVCLEVGYQAFFEGGYTRETLRGFSCGVFLGFSGSDRSTEDFQKNYGHSDMYLGTNSFVTSSRLSHCLGLRGPCVVSDTACSSSLIAINAAHVAMRRPLQDQVHPGVSARLDSAIAIGLSLLLSPTKFLMYCGPRMLSPRGRCFTFDTAADGFLRGEGCGAVLLSVGDDDEEVKRMLACLIGSAVNQDGRSASMTAPNGPSQQLVIRASLADTGFLPDEITVAECHGTGTALGDPIEVSALRKVMQDRVSPVLNTSAKTCVGHMEAAAGLGGFARCIMMLLSSCAAPNAHLHRLNPHLDITDYPVLFVSESTDCGENVGTSGVSSFGFGGTNGRCDLWGRCKQGPRATSHLETGQFLESVASFYSRVQEFGKPGPHESDELFIIGSWSAWTTLHEMTSTKVSEYTAVVAVGETCCEQFRVVVNEQIDQTIHPLTSRAGCSDLGFGPDDRGTSTSWLIDGREDGALPGDLYRIKLSWTFSWEHGEIRKVSWHRESTTPSSFRSFRCSFSVIGSWTTWRYQRMSEKHEEEGSSWFCAVRVGTSGQEEFQLARDGDATQAIYPVESVERKRLHRSIEPKIGAANHTGTPSVASGLQGPDEHGAGRHFLLEGQPGGVATIRLIVKQGVITVTVTSSYGEKTWRSVSKPRFQNM
eukprot:TRINITY_DN37768_c0_g1_i1.p1 TRINITY_DN37768_c0_g1~~TRINITY_DN37768_c0_g1_i1.p1  ORF type:complete len:1070 (+),score=102.66 TRINITY_DN37768_c0_g1_i1:98-3307(+)